MPNVAASNEIARPCKVPGMAAGTCISVSSNFRHGRFVLCTIKLVKSANIVLKNPPIRAKIRLFLISVENLVIALMWSAVKLKLIPHSFWKLPEIIEKNCIITRKEIIPVKMVRSILVITELFCSPQGEILPPIVAVCREYFFTSFLCKKKRLELIAKSMEPKTALAPLLSHPVS